MPEFPSQGIPQRNLANGLHSESGGSLLGASRRSNDAVPHRGRNRPQGRLCQQEGEMMLHGTMMLRAQLPDGRYFATISDPNV